MFTSFPFYLCLFFVSGQGVKDTREDFPIGKEEAKKEH